MSESLVIPPLPRASARVVTLEGFGGGRARQLLVRGADTERRAEAQAQRYAGAGWQVAGTRPLSGERSAPQRRGLGERLALLGDAVGVLLFLTAALMVVAVGLLAVFLAAVGMVLTGHDRIWEAGHGR